jgi:hypothetical protein
MCAHRLPAHLAGVALLAAITAPAQDRGLNPAVHVAFVGDLQSDRGKDFVQFLRAQFARVDTVERGSCVPAQLRCADVVVLDWPQQGAISYWIDDKQAPHHNPLGELDRWDRPTVLLGSAGLNAAADWNLPGTFG